MSNDCVDSDGDKVKVGLLYEGFLSALICVACGNKELILCFHGPEKVVYCKLCDKIVYIPFEVHINPDTSSVKRIIWRCVEPYFPDTKGIYGELHGFDWDEKDLYKALCYPSYYYDTVGHAVWFSK